ncbi:MAG: DUF5618 family protein [Chitinispirillia bacterium]|nr:DUF5618 family protein [Chitinispirillia bacterium]MCL2267937.1 DUF5618 family protein [Chitinispirillia bacterium]
MTVQEQNAFLSAQYAEATRYMDNAKEALRKAGKDEEHYRDAKYVRTACGIAYNGVLIALDAWFNIKGVPPLPQKQRKSEHHYRSNLAALDKKMATKFNDAYDVLHLFGYYDGVRNIKLIQLGFEHAYYIIDKIKPDNPVEITETKGAAAKRAMKILLITAAAMLKL